MSTADKRFSVYGRPSQNPHHRGMMLWSMNDSQPSSGSDGHVADWLEGDVPYGSTTPYTRSAVKAAAEQACAEANARFESAKIEKAKEGRAWMQSSAGSRPWFWGLVNPRGEQSERYHRPAMTEATTTRVKSTTATKRDVSVSYRSIDRFSQTRSFKTLEGAQAYAQKMIGAAPTLGSFYAVSDDGIGRITVNGATLHELFPRSAAGERDEYGGGGAKSSVYGRSKERHEQGGALSSFTEGALTKTLEKALRAAGYASDQRGGDAKFSIRGHHTRRVGGCRTEVPTTRRVVCYWRMDGLPLSHQDRALVRALVKLEN